MSRIQEVLEALSYHGLVKLHKPRGNWYTVHCPFHSDGNEKRPSCGVSLNSHTAGGTHYPEGIWHCFACGASYDLVNGVDIILKAHDIKMTGTEWLKKNVPGFDISDEPDFQPLIETDLAETISSKFAVNMLAKMNKQEKQYVSEEELAKYRFTIPYMYERKLTDDIIAKYDIGFDANFVPEGRKRPVPSVTFPVRDIEGRTLFFCRRSVEGKFYHYPEGVTKPVFGIDMIPKGTKSVVICESCINALTAVSYGYPAIALMGTGNPLQMRQLISLGASEYVLALDGDTAGRRAAKRIKSKLKSVALIWTMEMPDGKDVNDLSKEEFEEIYRKKE